jgi:hypothetical protein
MLIVVKRPITKIPHYLSHADVALTMKVYALALLKAQEAGHHERSGEAQHCHSVDTAEKKYNCN